MDKFFRAESIEIKGKTRGGKVKVAKYDRSFMALLIQNDKAKEFYNEIKNYCLAFERVKVRPSWGAEGFAAGTETVVKMIVKGGVLCVCFAFPPTRYSQNAFPHLDLSDDRELQNTPFCVPVRNPAEHKIARRLVAEAFTSRCVYTVDFPTRSDYISSLKTQTDEALIKKKLIRVTELEMSEADAKRALALALQEEAEEEKEIEDIGKKRRKSKKSVDASEPAAQEEETQEPVSEPVEEQAEESVLPAEEQTEPEKEPTEEFVFEVEEEVEEQQPEAVAEQPEEIAEEPEVVAEQPEEIAEQPEEVAEELEEIAEQPEEVAEQPEEIAEQPEEVAEEGEKVEEENEEIVEEPKEEETQEILDEQEEGAQAPTEELPTEDLTEEAPEECTEEAFAEEPAEELPEEEPVEEIPVEQEENEEEPVEQEPVEDQSAQEDLTEEQPLEEEIEDVDFDADDEAQDVDLETEDEEEIVFELADDGLVIEVKYDRSFTARIIQNEGAKRYYNELKNLCLSYDLKPRVSWKADTFHLGRTTYVVMKVRGKTLCLYLALDPAAYENRIYHHKDVSSKKSYQTTPMMVRVKSPLGLKKAKALIAEMMQKANLSAKERDAEDFVAMYPYEDTEALIQKNLVKRVERKLDREESERVIESGKLEESQEQAEEPIAETQEPEEVAEEPAEELPEEEPAEEIPVAQEENEEEPVEEPIAEEPAEEEEEPEEIFFELDDTPEELSEEEEKELTGDEEPEEEDTAADSDDDVEDVSFELAEVETEDDVQDSSGMESYGKADADGKYVTLKKYMRGFAAKMKQGDQDRKDYYAEIKAKMLSYKGVKVSESFPGESYKKGSRALLKARVRGKTLCLFFALNVDNYKQTVYRQQYKGDVKAYAATPMMVRVRSEQGLKRALRLIEEMERNYSLVLGEPVSVVEVRRDFLYEETSDLVEKGLIKTRLVTVTQYEAEQLLKKKAR